MNSFILCIGLWMPGVSMNTIWAPGWFTMPRILFLVVWGLSETMASFSPKRAFRSVDLPTFGLPTMEMKPDLNDVVSAMGDRIPEKNALRNKKAGRGRFLIRAA